MPPDGGDDGGAAPRDPYMLGSLRKGLEVIDCFARQESWSLAELAATLSASKPTIFRILHTLEDFGYLRKDAATGRYTLGLRFHTLGRAAVSQAQLRWQSLPPLQDLARETGETVHVGVLYDDEAICVQAVEGTRLIRMHAFVGKRTAPHASALGKVLLAALPDAEVEAFLARAPLRRFTPRTIVTAEGLRAEIARVRRQGYALDEEELEVGLRCLSVPIGDGMRRHAGAALGLSAPAARMDAERVAALVPLVQARARRIAQMIAAAARPDGEGDARMTTAAMARKTPA